MRYLITCKTTQTQGQRLAQRHTAAGGEAVCTRAPVTPPDLRTGGCFLRPLLLVFAKGTPRLQRCPEPTPGLSQCGSKYLQCLLFLCPPRSHLPGPSTSPTSSKKLPITPSTSFQVASRTPTALSDDSSVCSHSHKNLNKRDRKVGPKAGVHVCIHGRARQHRGPCESACHTAGFTFCSVGTCVPVMVGFFNCYLSVKPSLAVLSYLSFLVCKPWVTAVPASRAAVWILSTQEAPRGMRNCHMAPERRLLAILRPAFLPRAEEAPPLPAAFGTQPGPESAGWWIPPLRPPLAIRRPMIQKRPDTISHPARWLKLKNGE